MRSARHDGHWVATDESAGERVRSSRMPGPNLLGGRFPGRLGLYPFGLSHTARSEKLLAHTGTRYAHTRAASTRQSRSAAQIRTRRYAPDARASPLITPPPPPTPPRRRPGPRPRLSRPPAHFGAHQWSSISRRTRSSSAEAQRAVRSAAQACACGKEGRRGRLAGAYLPMSISTDGSMGRGWRLEAAPSLIWRWRIKAGGRVGRSLWAAASDVGVRQLQG